jgi:hypothetical protein
MFVEGTITSQEYLQQLQNEVILEAGHVDTFLQQDGVCPHTENVILGVVHVCLVAMSCQTDLQRFRGGLVLATTFSWTF